MLENIKFIWTILMEEEDLTRCCFGTKEFSKTSPICKRCRFREDCMKKFKEKWVWYEGD